MAIPIKVLHVDDDEQSRMAFRRTAAAFSELQYAEAFGDAESCYDYLRLHRGNCLLFLDVELPGNNGLWLARQLTGLRISIVFLTNHAEYAHPAFEACALQFITKPISAAKLTAALHTLKANKARLNDLFLEQLGDFYQQTDTGSAPKRLFVPMADKTEVIGLEDLLYITSRSNNYSEFVMKDGRRILSSKTIKTYEEILSRHPDFVRVHKSSIINKNYLSSISRKQRNIRAIMSNGEELDISYQRKDEILEQLMC